MVATDILPLSFVESNKFQEFIKIVHPQYAIPSRRTISRKIMTEIETIKKDTYLATEKAVKFGSVIFT